jgi:hypothetical protein
VPATPWQGFRAIARHRGLAAAPLVAFLLLAGCSLSRSGEARSDQSTDEEEASSGPADLVVQPFDVENGEVRVEVTSVSRDEGLSPAGGYSDVFRIEASLSWPAPNAGYVYFELRGPTSIEHVEAISLRETDDGQRLATLDRVDVAGATSVEVLRASYWLELDAPEEVDTFDELAVIAVDRSGTEEYLGSGPATYP